MKTLIKFISSLMSEWAFFLVVSCIALYNARLLGMNAYQIIPLPFVIYYFLNFSKHESFNRDYIILFILLMVQVFFFTIASEKVDIIGNMKVYILSLMVMTYKPKIRVANNLMTVLAISGLILGAYMLKNPEYLGGVRLTVVIGGVRQDPTWITVLLLPSFCLGICMLGEKNIMKKILGISMMLFCAYIVFLSGSRGTLISMVIAIVSWIVYNTNKANIAKTLFILPIFLVIGYFFFSIVWEMSDIALLSRYVDDDTAAEGRLRTWALIINGLFESNISQFLFGHGLGACIRDFRLDAHNMFLQQIYEMGIFGFLVMVIFIVKIIRTIYSSKDVCCICLINSLVFVSLLTPIWGHIYYFMLLSTLLYIVNAQKQFSSVKS